MLLALDIGNTNITLGAFQGDDLRATWRLFTDHHRQPDEYAVLLHELLPLKGIQAQDIQEVIMICAIYAAAPNAVGATQASLRVFEELGI